MTPAPAPLLVRPTGPVTVDRASVVAMDAMGTVVGRATLSRTYGACAELQLELAHTGTVALTLIDAIERAARERGLVRLELDASTTADRLVSALRRARPTQDEQRGADLRVTWTTTP
jgi:hypothetical protein